MFVAPDPGRARLRAGLRAVAGIGLACAADLLAGLPLTAVVAGGLAALLALFTVADPGVGRQAVTTALLPVVGYPVLALAAVLDPYPPARDAAFLAVVFAGVYARRWGPRGHALGVFAFMMFFTAQFVKAQAGQLPELFAALSLGLACAAVVRFGFWCYERRSPLPPAVTHDEPGGLRRPTTRQAFQALAAAAFALGVGELVSGARWYWAVAAAWWIFVNTASRGETLVRGFRRFLGTVLGMVAGLAVALPVGGAPVPTVVLLAACVFGVFYAAPVSYSWMMFCVTLLAGLLYGLMGVLTPALLVLRVEETLTGALGAALAVALVLPVTTHAATDTWIRHALHAVRDATTAVGARTPLEPHIARLDLLLGRVRLAVAPLVHPLSPLRARKERARQVLELLDDCARQVRGLAAVVAEHTGPAHGAHPAHHERLRAACARVEEAIAHLVTPHAHGEAARHGVDPAHEPPGDTALGHLHALERSLTALHAPLRADERAPVAA
ncbi:FUSC family protein [Streptantibioticus parmotrematis]|uniref:FUSC family protein n=1 Tax=Streptantibioticus parmotrematis TaxID=2873249 RepID=UPI00340597E1